MRTKLAVLVSVVLICFTGSGVVEACGLGWHLCRWCHHYHCWCQDCSRPQTTSGNSAVESGSRELNAARAIRDAQMEKARADLRLLLRQLELDPNAIGATSNAGLEPGARGLDAATPGGEGDRSVADFVLIMQALPVFRQLIEQLRTDVEMLKSQIKNTSPKVAPEKEDPVPGILKKLEEIKKEVEQLKAGS